jgi:2-hydroxycyclohexanecarboxyl-CoA dehydrogenase
MRLWRLFVAFRTPPRTQRSTQEWWRSPAALPSTCQHGIRVNAIAPDLADTPQTPAELMLRGRDPDLIRTWIPVGRFGRPDDYAAVVEFLASDDARFVTGQTIPVDGGTLAASGWFARADRKGWTNMPNEA